MFPVNVILRVLRALVLVFLLTNQSLAAQNTQVEAIGYSAQGRYFAYEEFGVDEEIGTAYSTIYLLDMVQITQVVGTPVIFRANISDIPLAQIRQQARSDAEIFLQSLQISQPAIVAALNGDGQISEQKTSLEFGVPVFEVDRRLLGKYQLSLEIFDTASTAGCADFISSAPLGFKLDIENFGASREVYADKMLPRSRDCPIEYEIYSVVLPFGATDISKSVGLISVLTQGPEGLNRHFIAIPLAFNLQGIN